MIHVLWWKAWQDHLQNARKHPSQAEGYCRAAAIAHVQYMMYSVLYWNGVKP